MLNCVIFSKDRPAQLSACIRSFLLYFKDLTQFKMTVVYRATTADFENGYKKVFSSLPTTKPDWVCFSFIQETDFQRNVLGSIDSLRELTMFLVDDILFRAPWSLEDKEIKLVKDNEQLVATSLRLYKGITHCYATNTPSQVPNFVKGCVWKWKGCDGDWAVPHSLDGNIFRTNYIVPLLKQLKYSNPNQLEAQLSMLTSNIPDYMCAYVEGSKLINIPANIVQNQFKNRVGNLFSTEELNKNFLEKGAIISVKRTLEQQAQYNTVHAEIMYVFDYTYEI